MYRIPNTERESKLPIMLPNSDQTAVSFSLFVCRCVCVVTKRLIHAQARICIYRRPRIRTRAVYTDTARVDVVPVSRKGDKSTVPFKVAAATRRPLDSTHIESSNIGKGQTKKEISLASRLSTCVSFSMMYLPEKRPNRAHTFILSVTQRVSGERKREREKQ